MIQNKLRYCAKAQTNSCDTCPGPSCTIYLEEIMLAAADRMQSLILREEKERRRLDETAGIAMKLQERLDRIYGLAERELSLTLEGLLDGSADQMD